MKIATFVVTSVAGLMLIALSAGAASAQQSKMKACADEWNKVKAANQTEGKTYRDFSKECMSRTGDSSAAPAAAAPAPKPAASSTAAAPAAKPAAPAANSTTTAAKPVSSGREAMVERERACGAEWKADKAAGKIAAGMTWPKYWSACNERKKAAGM